MFAVNANLHYLRSKKKGVEAVGNRDSQTEEEEYYSTLWSYSAQQRTLV